MKIISMNRKSGNGEKLARREAENTVYGTTIQLSGHFTLRRLLRYTLPSVVMLIFTTLYSVVDGFFVSNCVGKTPFAAVNFIMPFLMILGCTGFMFGTGGSALISKTLGKGDQEKANELFSMIVYAALACGILLMVIGLVFVRPFAVLMGAEGQLLEDSVVYGRAILLALPFFTLQYEFQCLFATAGKPNLGLAITVTAGLTNVVLDALFVAAFRWGLEGAAAATAFSQLVGGVVPLLYFGRANSSCLRLGKCRFDARALLKTCTNGSSELLSGISTSIVSILYNLQLMRWAGENGVAAYGVLMYVSAVFQAVFIGYSVGAAPVIGYHYGAQNYDELKNLRKMSMVLIAVFSAAMFLAGQSLARPLSLIFVGYDGALLNMTLHAFLIFSFSFLLSGVGVFGSAFFTALNNGAVSALISFLRTMVFQCFVVIVLPMICGLDGIWMSIVVAEALAAIVTVMFLIGKQKTYHY